MKRANEPEQLYSALSKCRQWHGGAAPKRGKHVTFRFKSSGRGENDCKWHSIPKQLQEYKTQWWSHSTPNFFHTGPRAQGKTPRDNLPFSRLKSRLGWSGGDPPSCNAPLSGRNYGLKQQYLGKYPQCTSYEFPLGRHFCFCESLSTTMTLVIVSLRRAQWHDGPTQREMQREAAAAGGGTTMCATEEKCHLLTFIRVFTLMSETATPRDCPESCVVKWSLKPPVMFTAQFLKTRGEWNMSSQIWLVPPSRCISFTSRCLTTKTTTTTTHVIQYCFVMPLN